MKTILITVFFKILFLDSQNQETLTGVRVETNNGVYYSDLSGEVFIPTEEKIISVDYVSYISLENITSHSDTTIHLCQVK
jgi:hypothetical protein